MTIEFIEGRGYYSNSYICGNILFDAGLPTEFFAERKSDIEIIVITHSHFDHIAHIKEISELCEAEIFIHELDAPGLTDDSACLSGIFSERSPNITPDRLLKDGDRVENFEVIHTPGHSRGSICLYDREDESHPLISGDTVFADGGFGRVDLYGGDASEMGHSLRRLSEIDIGGLFPGHGRAIYSDGNRHISDSLESFNQMYPGH